MGSYDGIKNLSPRNKSILMRTNEFVKEGLEAIHHSLSKNLINYVTKVDWSKIFQPLRVLNFRDENNEGLVEFL